jgi:2-iminobutanoate/2-iminopropanoate deaminase
VDHAPITSPAMPKPLAHYSQVVRAGDFLFVAGQPGIDPATDQVVEGGFEAEARQAFANLRAVLDAAGSGLGHVVKTTTFVAHVEDS